jgi:hypothetical protein
MPRTHLFAFVLLFSFSLSAFAQDKPSAPSRIIPNQTSDASSGMNSLDRRLIDQSKIDQNKIDQNKSDQNKKIGQNKIDQFRIGPNGRPFKVQTPDTLLSGLPGQDNSCYAIRSYVVARDDKNSDSTHLVGYSTCQPSSRYHVKSAEARAPGDR